MTELTEACQPVYVHTYGLDRETWEQLFDRVAEAAHALDESVSCSGGDTCSLCGPPLVVEELMAENACPTCSWPTRETTHMICMDCGTDYLAAPPQKLSANAFEVLCGYRAEVHRLRAENKSMRENVAHAAAIVAGESNYDETEAVRIQRDEARAENTALGAKLAAGDASDGFHTHKELYESRLLLHAHAAPAWLAKGWEVVKSRRHHDGEPCFDGAYFIVVAQLPTGQISFHYANADWDLFDVPEVALPPEWDGHSPAEAARRLRDALLLAPDAEGV
jgi:hypothetical protein